MSPAPFKVKALFEYTSSHEDDLPFSAGQIITVTDEEDADWYGGQYVDDSGVKQEGIFPRNFVEKYEPVAPPRPARTRTKREADVEPAPASRPARRGARRANPGVSETARPRAGARGSPRGGRAGSRGACC